MGFSAQLLAVVPRLPSLPQLEDSLGSQLVDDATARVARSVTEATELGTRCNVTLAGTPCHGSSLRSAAAARWRPTAGTSSGGRQRSEKASNRWLPKERCRSATCRPMASGVCPGAV